MMLKTKQKSTSKVTAASANVESNISDKKQTLQKTSDVQNSATSGEDKILAAIEAMKVELRAEMKAEIAAVKKSVSLEEKIPQFKSGQPSNYFDGTRQGLNKLVLLKGDGIPIDKQERLKNVSTVISVAQWITEIAESHHCNFCGKNEVPGRRKFK